MKTPALNGPTRTTGRRPPPFSSTPFPLPFAATQMDRLGFHPLGLHSALRYVDDPFSISTAKARYAPLLSSRVRPPALDAATKGTQGTAAAPVFLWTLFPHPICGCADTRPVCADAVLHDSTRPLATSSTSATPLKTTHSRVLITLCCWNRVAHLRGTP